MKLALNLLKYEDIKENIIKLLTAYSPYSIANGGQFDFNSSNISYFTLAMAYVEMMTSFNLSNIANNVFLETTEERQMGVSKSKECGYTPKRPEPSKFTGTLIYKGTAFDSGHMLTITPRAPFRSNMGNYYYNFNNITLKYNGNPTQLEGEYLLYQGEFKYHIEYPDGAELFEFVINNNKVAESNFSLYVVPLIEAEQYNFINDPSLIYLFPEYKWERVKNISETINKNIYFIEESTANEGFPQIVFGNGIIGNIPSNKSVIICEYFETNGIDGNNDNLVSIPPPIITTGTLNDYLFYDVTKLPLNQNFSVNNFDLSILQNVYNKSFGGTSLESLENIKFNAPRFFSSDGNIVTRNDYIRALSGLSEIGNFSVVGGDSISPYSDDNLGKTYICLVPKLEQVSLVYNNSIYVLQSIQKDIENKFKNNGIVNTQRIYKIPSYLLVDVIPKVKLDKNIPTETQINLKSTVKKMLNDLFNDTFNKLGVPFVSENIDTNKITNLAYVKTIDLSYDFNFVINNATIGVLPLYGNTLSLPILTTENAEGIIISTEKFLKTNYEVVAEMYPFAKSETLLTAYLKYLSPKNRTICSIYGLINYNLNRSIYNSDITENTSSIVLDSTNNVLNLTFDSLGIIRSKNNNLKITDWNIEQSSTNKNFAKVNVGNIEVGIFENCHLNTISGNMYKGYITQSIYDSLDVSLYDVGNYFICSEVIYDSIKDEVYVPNDVLYIKKMLYGIGEATIGSTFVVADETSSKKKVLVKANIKRSISTTQSYLLNTNFNQGDIFKDGSTYVVYDINYNNDSHTRPINIRLDNLSNPLKLDASQLLPKELTCDTIVKVTLDAAYDINGIQVNYPDTYQSKISALRYKGIDGYTWEELPNTRVYNGDVLIYSKDRSSIPDGWYLIENLSKRTGRLNYEPILTNDLESLSTRVYDTFKINNNIMLTTELDKFMFVNPPSDNILNKGDIIICVNISTPFFPRGLWKIFDDDYFSYNIDVVNSASSFPIPVDVGDVFDIKNSKPSITNFSGGTSTTSYTSLDKIMYIGNDEWKKYIVSTDTPLLSEAPDAKMGDLIQITDSGMLSNDSRLDVHKYTNQYGAEYMMFDYNDILYFTGTKWMKVFPYRVYTTNPEYINSIGFNSDIYTEPINNSSVNIFIRDFYHGESIGTLVYNTGILTFSSSLNKHLNKTDVVVSGGNLTDIFKYQNYINNSIKTDIINIKTKNSHFDTTFTQYIACNVIDVEVV